MKTFTAIAAIALALAPTAHAQTQDSQAPRAMVRYGDLDLSYPKDREVLEHRVASAVNRVCGGKPGQLEFAKLELFRICTQKAWEGARPQLAAAANRTNLAQTSVQIAAGPR